MVIGPVLWVPLLQTTVHLCRFIQTLQLQQQLSCRDEREDAQVDAQRQPTQLNLIYNALHINTVYVRWNYRVQEAKSSGVSEGAPRVSSTASLSQICFS